MASTICSGVRGTIPAEPVSAFEDPESTGELSVEVDGPESTGGPSLEAEELESTGELSLRVEEPVSPDELSLTVEEPESTGELSLTVEESLESPGEPSLTVEEPLSPDELSLTVEESLEPPSVVDDPPSTPPVELEPHAIASTDAQTNANQSRCRICSPLLNEFRHVSGPDRNGRGHLVRLAHEVHGNQRRARWRPMLPRLAS
jgi:hypothetical protein